MMDRKVLGIGGTALRRYVCEVGEVDLFSIPASENITNTIQRNHTEGWERTPAIAALVLQVG